MSAAYPMHTMSLMSHLIHLWWKLMILLQCLCFFYILIFNLGGKVYMKSIHPISFLLGYRRTNWFYQLSILNHCLLAVVFLKRMIFLSTHQGKPYLNCLTLEMFVITLIINSFYQLCLATFLYVK